MNSDWGKRSILVNEHDCIIGLDMKYRLWLWLCMWKLSHSKCLLRIKLHLIGWQNWKWQGLCPWLFQGLYPVRSVFMHSKDVECLHYHLWEASFTNNRIWYIFIIYVLLPGGFLLGAFLLGSLFVVLLF